MTLRFLAPTFVDAMSSGGETDNTPAQPTVFLSYASEDRSAATAIRDAMAAAGLDVWYDENELGGGDAWDKKIRRQIRECDYFMAVISAQTEARREGYFRREWRLVVERALDMADDHPFILPVVIDDTDQSAARVPEKFLEVQWLKVPSGKPTPGLAALCSRLLAGSPLESPAPKRAPARPRAARVAPPPGQVPEFPREEPGQRVRFWFHVVGWAAVSARVHFRRLPRWVRLVVYLWLFILVISRTCSRDRPSAGSLSPDSARKLDAIADKYKYGSTKEDAAKLGLEIAHAFADDEDENAGEGRTLLVEPFMDPADNPAEAKLANTTLVLLYGHLMMAHQGQVALGKEPLASLDIGGAVDRGRKGHSKYVIVGGIKGPGGSRTLDVEIIRVSDSSVLWTKSYPVADADPAAIAQETEGKVPSLED